MPPDVRVQLINEISDIEYVSVIFCLIICWIDVCRVKCYYLIFIL